MAGAQGVDDSHIQGEGTKPNGPGAIRQGWKKASPTSQEDVSRPPSPIQKCLGPQLGPCTVVVQEVPQAIVESNSITAGHTRLWVAALYIHRQTAKTAGPAPKAHIDAKATAQTSQEIILGEIGVKYARRDKVQNRFSRVRRTCVEATNIVGACSCLPSQNVHFPESM